MTTPPIPFRRNAVEPVECIKAGWELIKDQYWLFVGMTLIAFLIGQAVPLGILLGPMMSGLYIAFLKKRRGEPFEFGTLFKGFDFFAPSLIATLLHVVPIIAIVIPAYLFFYVGLILSMAAQAGSENPSPAPVLGVFVMFTLFILVVVALVLIISIGFTFSYPLIVDRKLAGFDAVKVSFKAAMANFWRVLLMYVLTGLLNLAGVLFCYVGVFLVLPIGYAAIAAAYEQVFGLFNPEDAVSNLPPPPPTFN